MIMRFVTATGTGLGKTLVTAALCHQLRGQHRTVQALKPIVTGLAETPLEESDPAILSRSLGVPLVLDAIAPFRFAAPLAPAMAAAREGRSLDVEAVVRFCLDRARGPQEVLLVEGVGGVMVPLAPGATVLDWIRALHCPVILVAGSYLGSLSHTLTALAVLRQAGLSMAGLVISETEGGGIGLAETAAALRPWTAAPVLALPRITGPEPWQRAPDLTALVS